MYVVENMKRQAQRVVSWGGGGGRLEANVIYYAVLSRSTQIRENRGLILELFNDVLSTATLCTIEQNPENPKVIHQASCLDSKLAVP
jgi:hypothetical protein